MKVVVHVGQAKTGTTSLQKTFKINRGNLQEQGFLYPACGKALNHSLLTIPFTGKPQRSLRSRAGSNPEEACAYSLQLWSELSTQTADANTGTIILSSEFFWRAPFIEKLPSFIERHIAANAELEFLAYIRRPSEHYVSLAQQSLKANHILPRIKRLDRSKFKRLTELGPLTIRSFDRKSLIDEDIVADACAVIGIDARPLEHPGKEANTSLSAEGMALLQEYRLTQHADKPNVFTPDTKRLLRMIRTVEANHPSRFTKPRLRRDLAQWLDFQTRDLLWIRDTFGVDLSFDHGGKPPSSEAPDPIERVKDIVDYNAEALAFLRKKVARKITIPSMRRHRKQTHQIHAQKTPG